MEIETQRLESIATGLQNMMIDSFYELRTRGDGSEISPFIQIYHYYNELTERWKGQEILVLDPYSLRNEVENNFLVTDDIRRSNYITLLNSKLTQLGAENERIRPQLATLKSDIKDKKADPKKTIHSCRKYEATLSTFVYYLEDVLESAERVEWIINENIKIFSNVSSSTDSLPQPIPTETSVKLQWKGNKTDLAELIWALAKSERITDITTGKPVAQKELVSQIVALLGLDSLDVANLMKTKYDTKSKSSSYKAKDGKTFPAELQNLLLGRLSE